ncbi:MAG TPA: hypothetical protein PKN60_07545, partial [Bacteroidales bacterium]|nr:hypothetical protein [Bacteroidales bacterium]
AVFILHSPFFSNREGPPSETPLEYEPFDGSIRGEGELVLGLGSRDYRSLDKDPFALTNVSTAVHHLSATDIRLGLPLNRDRNYGSERA